MVFVIPFVGLLGAKPKQHPPTFLLFALVSLVGIWLERYLEIVPSINGGAGPAVGVPGVRGALGVGGVWAPPGGWVSGRHPPLSPPLPGPTPGGRRPPGGGRGGPRAPPPRR